MEIIILPYMAISFVIGWAVFSPFSQFEDLKRRKFAKVETGDLLAMFLPFSLLLAIAKWSTSAQALSVLIQVTVTTTILLFALFCLVAGLFLFPKMNRPPSFKRIAIIAIVIPLGTLLTVAWVAIPFLAYAGSFYYAIPATLAILPATLTLRYISIWACACGTNG